MMHIMVVISPEGLASAMTGRDRPEGMLINLYPAVEVKQDGQGTITIQFEIPDGATDGINVG